MKRIWQHPEEPKTGRRYWRSINELEQREAFLKANGREFPLGDTLTEEEQESSRRNFLKLMGASTAMMGLAACRRPVTHILPFTNSVEWAVPGKAVYYATAMPTPNGGVQPLVVTTHDGRPTHLAPNPLHPSSSKGICGFAQASILDLYDPERSRTVLNVGKASSWKALNAEIAKIAKAGGEGLALLVGGENSPTAERLRGEVFKALPKAKLFKYEPTAGPAVNAKLFGSIKPVVRLEKALRVLTLDCDFLGLDPVSDEAVSAFMKNRNAEKPAEAAKMSRLYTLENRYTVTGGAADHRRPLAASQLAVAAALLVAKLDPAQAAATASLTTGAKDDLKKWVETAAEDLLAAKGKAVVLAGSRTSSAVQALAALANQALGAYGSVIEGYKASSEASGTIADLTAAVNSGAVKTIVCVSAADPLYDAASTLGKAITEKKTTLIHAGTRKSATSKNATWHIPAAHYLESWGDVRAQDGTYSIVQPMIAPLYDGANELEIYLALCGKKTLGPAVRKKDAKAGDPAPADAAAEAVKATFALVAGGADETKWNHTLRDGFLKGSKFSPVAPTLDVAAVSGLVGTASPAAPTKEAMEIVLVPDASLLDGRYVNNPWLQESPDPVSKVTWDNVALVGSVTYRDLGLRTAFGPNGKMLDRDTLEGNVLKIKIEVNGKVLEIPAIEAPGHVSNSITISLGYGQQDVGNVGKDTGFNAYSLQNNPGEFVLSGAKVSVTTERYQLAITQEQNTMEGRSVYREATAEQFEKDETFAKTTGIDSHIPPEMSFYRGQFGKKTADNPDGFDFDKKHQWGMTIDLSKCIGCTACLLACQSENNIPVVGKDQVQKGRVMHWIRMDRYFATAEWGEQKADRDSDFVTATAEQLENAEMVQQPVACQQCESAPCETVCPVNATVHTDEGLNAMAYNRCIGTRYCANNCPYTARRFNWFDYNKRPLDELYWGPLSTPEKTGVRESHKLQKNPNVTVRMRGVIEKCTYCVQRLENAKIVQKQTQRDSKNFRIAADGVKTACQEACSAGAIEFGDLANPDATINKTKASVRNYEVLKYLNTRPRTSYLARIRNTNPKMPGADKIAVWSSKQF